MAASVYSQMLYQLSYRRLDDGPRQARRQPQLPSCLQVVDEGSVSTSRLASDTGHNMATKLRRRELNPGLPRDRRKY